jgi:hypothetical protein
MMSSVWVLMGFPFIRDQPAGAQGGLQRFNQTIPTLRVQA